MNSPEETRRWVPFLVGIVSALLLIVVLALTLTRTDAGRERILGITLNVLGGTLHPDAELVIERLDGDLFTGARAYGLTLWDVEGREMIVADSAYIEYRLASLFGGDILINDLILYNARVHLYRFPGDTVWNYQAILQDTVPQEEQEPGGGATIIESLQLVEGLVTIQMAWEPSAELSEGEQQQEIQAALADDSRISVQAMDGGYVRTILVHTPVTALESLAIAPDDRGGTYLHIARVTADVGLYRDEPIRVVNLQGDLGFREGVLRYSAPEIQLPASRLSSAGVVDLGDDEPLYDLSVNGNEVALEDLQWLYPAFPSDGQARFGMHLETRPEGMFIRMNDLLFEAPRTRLAGDFALFMGDEMLFSDVSLRADPLDVDVIEGMLPMTIPVRGLEIGAVAIESAAS